MNRYDNNPGISHLLLTNRIKELEKRLVEKDALIARLKDELKVSALEGLTVRGWFCMKCDIFNGEEHSKRDICRHCNTDKPHKL